MCARRRSGFLLLRQKKVTKEKATLQAASLRFAAGKLRCSRPAGSRSNSLRFTALRQSRALIRWPLRSSAQPEGNPGCGHPHGPSLRCAALGPISRAQAPRAAQARPSAAMARGLSGCPAVRLFGCPPPLAAPAAGRLWGGTRVGARVLRELNRRGCPSGAAQQQSEFHGAPRNRPDAGLPRSEAQGPQTGGRLSLAYFSLAKQRKVSRPPGRQPGLRPQPQHAFQTSTPRLRQAQTERVPKNKELQKQ